MQDLPFELDEIDLRATTPHGGAGLDEGPQYLVLYEEILHVVRFDRMWFGLSAPVLGPYSPPGADGSKWQRAWLVTMKTKAH